MTSLVAAVRLLGLNRTVRPLAFFSMAMTFQFIQYGLCVILVVSKYPRSHFSYRKVLLHSIRLFFDVAGLAFQDGA